MTPSQLERRVRLLTTSVVVLSGVILVGALSAFGSPPSAPNDPATPGAGYADTLRVGVLIANMIEIEDDGVTRVRVGAKLPDAVIDGRRLERGDDIAGVLLYDADGRERSGYGTFDTSKNVVLTLDSQDQQHALFVAGPEGATALRLWHGDGAIDFRADTEGVRISVSENGVVTVQEPELRLSPSSEFCSFLRNPGQDLSRERLWSICRGRMGESWCGACVDGTR